MYLAGLGKKNNLIGIAPTASPQTEPSATPAPPPVDEQASVSPFDSTTPVPYTAGRDSTDNTIQPGSVPGYIAPANTAVSYNPLDYGIPQPLQKEPTFFQKLALICSNVLKKLLEWFR